MSKSTLYFSDNFFSAGLTQIYDENQQTVGQLDLKSVFSSSVQILDAEGAILTQGKFRIFSSRWAVYDGSKEIGELRRRMTFFKKRFEYDAYGRQRAIIESEAFSREYRISGENGECMAEFKRTSGLFQSASFQLIRYSGKLSDSELIAVVMGIHMIRKRDSQAAASSNSGGG